MKPRINNLEKGLKEYEKNKAIKKIITIMIKKEVSAKELIEFLCKTGRVEKKEVWKALK